MNCFFFTLVCKMWEKYTKKFNDFSHIVFSFLQTEQKMDIDKGTWRPSGAVINVLPGGS